MSVCFEWNFVHMLNQRDECLERKKEIETIIQKKKNYDQWKITLWKRILERSESNEFKSVSFCLFIYYLFIEFRFSEKKKE